MSHSTSDEIKALGLKVTAPRTRILELFQHSETRHLTAEDVYRILLAENLTVSIATVYRVLTQFEAAGILLRRSFDSEKSYYEINDGDSHDHLICLDCGSVTEFVDATIETRHHAISNQHGFQLVNRTTTLFGHCQRQNCFNQPTRIKAVQIAHSPTER